jgi:hypothetical protein
MWVGAEREQVLRLMLLDGLRPALVGLALGMTASVALTRLMRSVLYGTNPLNGSGPETGFGAMSVHLNDHTDDAA